MFETGCCAKHSAVLPDWILISVKKRRKPLRFCSAVLSRSLSVLFLNSSTEPKLQSWLQELSVLAATAPSAGLRGLPPPAGSRSGETWNNRRPWGCLQGSSIDRLLVKSSLWMRNVSKPTKQHVWSMQIANQSSHSLSLSILIIQHSICCYITLLPPSFPMKCLHENKCDKVLQDPFTNNHDYDNQS